MKNYIISSTCTLLHAMEVLEESVHSNYTLFVVNDDSTKLEGTLTDGDIRRYLIKRGAISDPVELAMNRHYKAIHQGESTFIAHLHQLRDKGIRIIPVLDNEGCIVDIIDLVHYQSHLPIDAVLMAGGKGERLRPLTENMPKPLLKVGDKSIIDYNIDRLLSFGLKHISVTVNYLHEQIEAHFLQERNGVKIACVKEPRYLGTIGSVKFVDTFYNDTVLVMNSDLFTNINLEDFYLHFKEHDADMSVAAVSYTVSVPYGIFDLKGRDIQGVKEKPTYNYYANAGIYLIKRLLLDEIPQDAFFNATDFIDMLIREKMKIVRFPITGYWIDIGNKQEYAKAQELVKHLSV